MISLPPLCGTPDARRRHVRDGTWPCPACLLRADLAWHPRARQDRLDADIRALVHLIAGALGARS